MQEARSKPENLLDVHSRFGNPEMNPQITPPIGVTRFTAGHRNRNCIGFQLTTKKKQNSWIIHLNNSQHISRMEHQPQTTIIFHPSAMRLLTCCLTTLSSCRSCEHLVQCVPCRGVLGGVVLGMCSVA